jgi:hypothetical protein
MLGDSAAWAIFLLLDLGAGAGGILWMGMNIVSGLLNTPAAEMLSNSYTDTIELTKTGYKAALTTLVSDENAYRIILWAATITSGY